MLYNSVENVYLYGNQVTFETLPKLKKCMQFTHDRSKTF